MDDTEILTRCQGLEKMLQDKGFVRPWAYMSFNYIDREPVFLQVHEDRDATIKTAEYFLASDAESAFEDATEWVESRPSVEESRRIMFLKQLGNVIDSGKELGVDLTYLKRAMDTLSENLLDKPRPSKVQLDNKES